MQEYQPRIRHMAYCITLLGLLPRARSRKPNKAGHASLRLETE